MRAFAFAPSRDHKYARERSGKQSLSENNVQAVRGRREQVRLNYLSSRRREGGGGGGSMTSSINHNQLIAGLAHSNHCAAGG